MFLYGFTDSNIAVDESDIDGRARAIHAPPTSRPQLAHDHVHRLRGAAYVELAPPTRSSLNNTPSQIVCCMAQEGAVKEQTLPEVPLRWSDFVWSLERLRHKPYGKKMREKWVPLIHFIS